MKNTNYSLSNLEIIEKDFQTSNQKTYNKSIKFLLNIDDKVFDKHLPYINFDELDIKSLKELDLSACFIENFSFKNYRNKYALVEDEKVNIHNFKANSSIFYTKNKTLDFSNLIIENDAIIDFSNSIFIADSLDFHSSEFKTKLVKFENSEIACKDVNFSDCTFGNHDTNFSNCKFIPGNISFKSSKFGKGEKLFINTSFNEGNISFDKVFFNEGKVSFKIASFGKGRKEFNEVQFGDGDVIFERVNFGNGNINFKDSSFGKGNVNFKKVEFGVGNKVFRSSTFGDGDITFMYSKFNDGKVNFALVEFGKGKIDFHFAEFGKGDKLFERTNFGNGQVNFSTVHFNEGNVNFKRAIFDDGLVNFEAAVLTGGNMIFEFNMFNRGVLNFNEAIFSSSKLIFNKIDFGQNMISFAEGQYGEIQLTNCQLNNNINLKALYIGKLDLSNSIIRDVVDIEPTEKELILKAVNFQSLRLLGTIYIDWKQLGLKELIYAQNNSYLQKSEQFRMLKENFNSIGRYEDEDSAYVEFKRTELKANYYKWIQNKPKFKMFAFLRMWFEKILFDKTGLYATSPSRVIVGMLSAYLIFSFTYYFMHFFTNDALISGVGNPDNLGFFATSFYHSAITFFTIGYGDIFPTGILRVISALEGFVGVFFMSYFTVAFVRKILR